MTNIMTAIIVFKNVSEMCHSKAFYSFYILDAANKPSFALWPAIRSTASIEVSLAQ
jgi:hypothetical protein